MKKFIKNALAALFLVSIVTSFTSCILIYDDEDNSDSYVTDKGYNGITDFNSSDGSYAILKRSNLNDFTKYAEINLVKNMNNQYYVEIRISANNIKSDDYYSYCTINGSTTKIRNKDTALGNQVCFTIGSLGSGISKVELNEYFGYFGVIELTFGNDTDINRTATVTFDNTYATKFRNWISNN